MTALHVIRPERVPESEGRAHWLRTVQIVSLTQALILVGFNFAFPFLPLFIQELGVTDRAQLALLTGLLAGSSGITMALISPVWGLLADRFGPKAMLVRAIGSGSLILATQALVSQVWQLAVVRVLNGALTGTQTAGAMLIASIVPRERTGFALGLLNTAVQVGNLVGPVLGGIVVVAFGLRGAFAVGAVLLLACVVLTAAFVDDAPAGPRPLPVGFRGSLRDVLVPFSWPGLRGVLVVGIVAQAVYSSTVAMTAIYVQDLARPPWLSAELAIGLSFGLGALAAAATMPLLGAYADRRDARLLLVASLGLFAVALVPQALVPDAVTFLFFRLVIGVALAGATSAVGVLTRAGARVGGEGRAFGAYAAAQNMGWGIGPVLGSGLAAVAGIPALYLVGAALVAVVLVPAATSRTWFATMEDAAGPA